MKLSNKQKEVIRLMRQGYFLYENRITPGARWSLTKSEKGFKWGNINGNVIVKIMPLIEGNILHTGCYEYKLNQLGNSVEL